MIICLAEWFKKLDLVKKVHTKLSTYLICESGKESKWKTKELRKTYDRDFKVSALKLILEKHQRVAKVCRDLGVSQNTLHKWKRLFLADSRNGFPGNGKVLEHEAEMRRLKRDLELVQEERDILKKAMGIFSQASR